MDPIKEAMEKPITKEEAYKLILECIESKLGQYGMITGLFMDILNKELATEYMIKAQRLISLIEYLKENLK